MNLKRISTVVIGSAAAVTLMAGPSLAAVTFYADDTYAVNEDGSQGDLLGLAGTGFVGKGDVQLAFTWSNKQLQSNAAGVSFSYVESTTKTQDCVTVDGQGREQVVTVTGTRTMTIGVSGGVSYDARVKNQITGFNLTGFQGDPTEDNSGWSSCPAGSQQRGAVETVTSAGLQASHGTNTRAL